MPAPGVVRPGRRGRMYCCLPQGVAHQYHADTEQPWTIYCALPGGSTAVFNQYSATARGRQSGDPGWDIAAVDRPVSRA